MLDVVIVDDEPLARDLLASILAEYPDINLMSACENGQVALPYIMAGKPDLVFLDIEMPEMTGLEVAVNLIDRLDTKDMPKIVFATAYDQYAINAFKVNAIDYILKPLVDEDVQRALERARYAKNSDSSEDTVASLDRMMKMQNLSLKDGEQIILVPPDQLLLLEAQGDYVSLHLKDRKRLIRATMKSLMNELPESKFQRVHRSFIINIDAIREVVPAAKGAATVTLSTGIKLSVSRTYKGALTKRLTT